MELSDAEPATETDVAEVVAGAEEIAIAGGTASRSCQCTRIASILASSGTSFAAAAAVAVDSSLAPPQPARIIEASAWATRTAVAFNLNLIPNVPSLVHLRAPHVARRQAVIDTAVRCVSARRCGSD
jgi:hypothetical protein